jgi:hypothetical protein
LTEDARGHPLQVPADVGGLSLTFDNTSSLRTVTGAPHTDSAVGKALRVINDPLGAATDSKSPAQRIVAVRFVALVVY